MAWHNEMGRLLRFQVDDIDCVTYDDETIREALLVGAQFVLNDAEFDTTYTVDIDTHTLSPDPTELTTKDNAFINLTVLKAACILLRGELKKASKQAIKIVDGPSTIDATGFAKALAEVAKEVCGNYEKLLHDYRIDYAGMSGEVITTPITVEALPHRTFRNFN